MKKNKLLVILSLALTLSCLLSALSMNVFAGMLENYYYVTNREVTTISEIYGSSYISFTGNYYGPSDSRNNAIMAAEANGGRTSDFQTTIAYRLAGMPLAYKDSDVEGTRFLSVTVTTSDIESGDEGYCSQECVNKNNQDNDHWGRQYMADWAGFPVGWINYDEVVWS